jgi:hypothetical protein
MDKYITSFIDFNKKTVHLQLEKRYFSIYMYIFEDILE